MNRVTLIGRLTSKPELRYTSTNIANTRFTLAVNRGFKKEDGTQETDFINCVAWSKNAELITQYCDKGSLVAVEGRIQTGSYEKDGQKIYTTDVVGERITFLSTKNVSNVDKSVSNVKEEKKEEPFSDFGDSLSIDDEFLD